jgi:hypothetical protein
MALIALLALIYLPKPSPATASPGMSVHTEPAAPAKLLILKRTQKYRILQMTELPAEKLMFC